MSDPIVGLDIGTSKIRVIIGEFSEEEKFRVTGVGSSVSTGLRKGVVSNMEQTISAVKDAIEKAELMSGREVNICHIAIGGNQVEGMKSNGQVAVTAKNGKGREIDESDIDRVMEVARAVSIPTDKILLHCIPQSYSVDGQREIKQPISMIGARLESDVYLVTASQTSLENLKRCVNRAQYEVGSVILKTLVASRSVMTDEERELGSILIDLGGGTTDVLVISEDAPLCTCSVPVGGKLATNDISQIKGISWDTAEQIKLKSGCCWESMVDANEPILIPGVGGRPPEQIPRTEICHILQPRIEEILCCARDKIAAQVGSRQLSGNVVLCGGGALMPGIIDLTQSVFDTTAVRIGQPAKISEMPESCYSPEYATVTGIVLARADEIKKLEQERGQYTKKDQHIRGESPFKSLLDYLKEWF